MRIVQLSPYAMERPGGVQAHVRDLAAWLEAQGHETRILCPPAPGTRPGTRGRVTRLGRARMLGAHGTEFEIAAAGPAAVRGAVRELRDWGAEIVHMHTPWTPMLAWQLWRALALPTVATVHATLPAPDSRGATDRYIRWAARRILPRCAALVVPSPAPLEMLRRVLPETRAEVLPPAIDLSPWRAAAMADTDTTAGPRAAGPLRLLFLGRLEPRKGVDVLLRAWPRIAEALPEARLTLAGDGPLRAAVEAAAGPRLALAGRPPDAEARRLVAEADLLLAPAPYGESFGLVLAEALSAGTLPVAAANPGYASLLTGPGAALLVPPGDARALAERVIGLARDAGARAELLSWGAARAAEVDVAAQGGRYIDLYRKVLGR
jgi:phosphatidylinositol alpha-mannosyltransferase